MSLFRTDTIVIGAGVVGLAVARALALKGREVVVLEANAAIGQETSSRNSEVIHAGIYYPPGSIKARTCVRGKQMLYDYCSAHAIPHRKDGKLIVASSEDQIPRLRQLAENAAACGVPDLAFLDRSRLAALEPEIHGKAALLSPSTGTLDSHGLMMALLADLESAGGTLVTRCRVNGADITQDGFRLNTDSDADDQLLTRCLVNSTGVNACNVAKTFSGKIRINIPELFLIKGQYFSYSAPSPFSHLVYPIPHEQGLGIHATHDQSGQLRFGPDAQFCDAIDYSVNEGSKADFARSIRHWYPALDEKQLHPAYAGIRPRLAARGFADFRISGPAEHGIPGLVNLFGIDSPGLTSCLALAEHVTAALD